MKDNSKEATGNGVKDTQPMLGLVETGGSTMYRDRIWLANSIKHSSDSLYQIQAKNSGP